MEEALCPACGTPAVAASTVCTRCGCNLGSRIEAVRVLEAPPDGSPEPRPIPAHLREVPERTVIGASAVHNQLGLREAVVLGGAGLVVIGLFCPVVSSSVASVNYL